MESEKVKEIKKALECCGEKVTCQGCPEYNNEPVIDWFECKKNLSQKTITLINELESENERIKRSKIIEVFRLEHRIDRLEHQIAEMTKETAKEILKMFYDRNYITEQDLKNAIAERFGLEGETWR